MFIYKITINNQTYVGLDTGPVYKASRWKAHCKEASSVRSKTKLHNIMRITNKELWNYEVIDTGFATIGQLASAEIFYIKHFNSFINGLNSTPGGDGLGKHDLAKMTNDELCEIKKSLGIHFSNYNKNIKWANTTIEDRKLLTKHLHQKEVYKARTQTLKEFYFANPDIKKQKGKDIKKWQLENNEQLKKQNKLNSLKGAAKVSKKIKVELETGEVLYYPSKSEFQRQTKLWANIIIEKTKQGHFYKGYKIWEE